MPLRPLLFHNHTFFLLIHMVTHRCTCVVRLWIVFDVLCGSILLYIVWAWRTRETCDCLGIAVCTVLPCQPRARVPEWSRPAMAAVPFHERIKLDKWMLQRIWKLSLLFKFISNLGNTKLLSIPWVITWYKRNNTIRYY